MIRARLQHVRLDVPPWQPPSSRTECGRLISASMPVIGRGEWRAIALTLQEERAVWAKMGVGATPDRKAPNVCARCWEACRWHPTWDQDPLAVMHRAYENGRLTDVRLRAELLAVADLATMVDPARFAELAAAHERDLRARCRPAPARSAEAAGLVSLLRNVL